MPPLRSLDGTELKVAARSQATTLAGAIAKRVRDKKSVALVAIGAEPVNQALKGIAIARKYLEEDHLDVDCASRARRGACCGLRHFREPASRHTPPPRPHRRRQQSTPRSCTWSWARARAAV